MGKGKGKGTFDDDCDCDCDCNNYEGDGGDDCDGKCGWCLFFTVVIICIIVIVVIVTTKTTPKIKGFLYDKNYTLYQNNNCSYDYYSIDLMYNYTKDGVSYQNKLCSKLTNITCNDVQVYYCDDQTGVTCCLTLSKNLNTINDTEIGSIIDLTVSPYDNNIIYAKTE